jgi:hypothetical protein
MSILNRETSQLLTQRLHLKLEDMDLQGMIDELTTAAWKVIYAGEPDHTLANYHNLREAMEAVLRRHVVAFDICGLAAVCREAAEVDAWQLN